VPFPGFALQAEGQAIPRGHLAHHPSPRAPMWGMLSPQHAIAQHSHCGTRKQLYPHSQHDSMNNTILTAVELTLKCNDVDNAHIEYRCYSGWLCATILGASPSRDGRLFDIRYSEWGAHTCENHTSTGSYRTSNVQLQLIRNFNGGIVERACDPTGRQPRQRQRTARGGAHCPTGPRLGSLAAYSARSSSTCAARALGR
jgi:hypothetical protein